MKLKKNNFWREIFNLLQQFFEPAPPLILPPAPTEEDEVAELVDGWPPFDGPLDRIPKGRKEMIEVYGDPFVTYTKAGKARVSREFARRLHTIPSSRLPGYGRRLYVNRIAGVYFIEALRRSNLVAPGYAFKRIGCFNPRHMRHDPARPLSDHTWGIAFDVNASENRAFYRKPHDPLPFEEGWRERSDLPKSVVLAWESVGFTWGGRWGNGKRGGFCDPMHFSLRK